VASNTLPQFPPTKIHLTNDPVIDGLVRRANDDMILAIARRMADAEAPRVQTTSVSLSKLAKPRRENGEFVEWVIRQHWLRKRPHLRGGAQRERGVNFHFYPSRETALAAWPTAKIWPWPDATAAPSLRMEMQQPSPRRASGQS
jgi:hypothetical protein